MIQSDMEEIMIRHMELLVKIAELAGSILQVDGLMPPRTPSIGPVSWGSPEECYTESDCIHDELKPPRKVETKDTTEKNEKEGTLIEDPPRNYKPNSPKQVRLPQLHQNIMIS